MGNIFKGSLMIIKAVRGPLQGLIRENNAKGVRRRGRKPRSQAAGVRRQEGQENPGA
jgi:hypothetical protein